MIKLNLEKKGKAAKATLDKCRNREVANLQPLLKIIINTIEIVNSLEIGCKKATLLYFKIIYNH